ncbi:hypothetical protein BJX62DRAFT_241047 [Aspergillus germanicus]
MSEDIEMISPPAHTGINLPLELCLEPSTHPQGPPPCRQGLLHLRYSRAFQIDIRFNGHSSNILPWIPEGIKSLAMSNRRFFVKEICLRDENPYKRSACSLNDETDGMDMDYLEDREIDMQDMKIKEADNSNSRIYQELPELLSSVPNVTFLEAHMWYSGPLGEGDHFVDIFRPLNKALGSWLLIHAPQKLTNVRVIDERQAAFSPPFLQDLHFESWTQAQTRYMAPLIRYYTDISDFDEEGDGNDDASASSSSQGSAAPQGGCSLMAALTDFMDIKGDFERDVEGNFEGVFEEDTDEDMKEDY